MRKLRLIVFAGLAAAAAFSTPARGQVQVNRSMEVQNFEPAIGPQSFLTVHGGDVLPHLAFNAGLYLGYQHNPVRGYTVYGEELEARVDVVRSQIYGNVVLAMGLFKYLQVGIGLPVALYQTGDGVDEMGNERAGGLASSAGVGDLRIHLAGRLVMWKGLHVAIALPVTVPTGDDESYLGERSLTLRPMLAVELRWRGLSVGANLGYLWRHKDTEFFSSKVGDQLLYSGAVAYNIRKIRLSILAEISGRHGFSSDFDEAPLEILAAVRLRTKQQIAITAGMGAGLIRGIGSPAFRAFAGIVWTYGFSRKARAQVADMFAPAPVKPKKDEEPDYRYTGPSSEQLDKEAPPGRIPARRPASRAQPGATPPARGVVPRVTPPPARRVAPGVTPPPARRVVPRPPARPGISKQTLAKSLAEVGLQPGDLPIFMKLNKSYQTMLQVVEQGADPKIAFADFQKRLTAKKCKRYRRAKRRWIRKKLKRRSGLPRKVLKLWKARYRAARKEKGSCEKRSLALSPVVQGILKALGSR